MYIYIYICVCVCQLQISIITNKPADMALLIRKELLPNLI